MHGDISSFIRSLTDCVMCTCLEYAYWIEIVSQVADTFASFEVHYAGFDCRLDVHNYLNNGKFGLRLRFYLKRSSQNHIGMNLPRNKTHDSLIFDCVFVASLKRSIPPLTRHGHFPRDADCTISVPSWLVRFEAYFLRLHGHRFL